MIAWNHIFHQYLNRIPTVFFTNSESISQEGVELKPEQVMSHPRVLFTPLDSTCILVIKSKGMKVISNHALLMIGLEYITSRNQIFKVYPTESLYRTFYCFLKNGKILQKRYTHLDIVYLKYRISNTLYEEINTVISRETIT